MSELVRNIRVQRFKGLKDVDLPLGTELTILVGPNNSGKSSLLQAIQFSVSVVQSLGMDGIARWNNEKLTGTLSTDQLVYTPLRDIQMLAHGGTLRQNKETAIIVAINSDIGSTEISVSRGKNKNISIQCTGKMLGQRLKQLNNPFSVIAPGLAGIPSYEEFKSEGIVRRAAARGDANNVFRNVLWILRNDPHGWDWFQRRLHDVFPDVDIDVIFDAANDEHIRATITRSGAILPIDASGTGVLQLAQVLAYIGVYSPQLLILDEPDAHLHPDNQRKLVRLLHDVAREGHVQVLISTHSRHMLDAAIPTGATVHWVHSGHISDAPFDVVSSLMNLGALDVGDRLRHGDIGTVVLTEDSRLEPIRALLAANGLTEPEIDIWSYGSCTKIDAATALGRFISEHAPGTNILVHRDRDYLSDDDLNAVIQKISNVGLSMFTTPGTDIESYFLQQDHILNIYSDIDSDEMISLIRQATEDTRNDSLERLINARVENAHRNRKNGQKPPNTGKIATQAQIDLDEHPERYRHGKSVLRRFNALVQERLGRVRNIFTTSNSLKFVGYTDARDNSIA
ncbi:ATP-binding protein [Mycobacterium sp. 1274756.6]|uniref:AAA family ATPase n=1 Tax=Mycobacterium sp. 1274756.6 TaxID=1834076 RepID=UPI0009EF1D97|nr:ATP-binding protein [Mycobacterium sp. 1274756.6]